MPLPSFISVSLYLTQYLADLFHYHSDWYRQQIFTNKSDSVFHKNISPTRYGLVPLIYIEQATYLTPFHLFTDQRAAKLFPDRSSQGLNSD